MDEFIGGVGAKGWIWVSKFIIGGIIWVFVANGGLNAMMQLFYLEYNKGFNS